MAKKKNSRKKSPKRKTPRLTKAERTALIPWDTLVKLKASDEKDMLELMNYVDVLRQGYKARVKYFQNKGVFSFAVEASNKLAITGKTARQLIKGKSPESARNALLHEFSKYQQFFQSKTSTLKGVQEENAKQDARILAASFSSESSELTQEERTAFWSAYEEFLNVVERKSPYMRTRESQATLGSVMFGGQAKNIEQDREIKAYIKANGLSMPEYLSYDYGSKLYQIYKAKYLLEREQYERELENIRGGGDATPLYRGGRNT